MDKAKRIAELNFKYWQGTITPEELRELESFNKSSSVNEEEFEKRTSEKNVLENLALLEEGKRESAASRVRLDQEYAKGRRGLMIRRIWRVGAAAAAILAIVAVGFLYTGWHQSNQPPVAIVSQPPAVLLPGKDKAILTLAGGEALALEKGVDRDVALDGNTKISVSADGKLHYLSLTPEDPKATINTLTTPRGGQFEVVLSDGTRVWLNSASSLKYPTSFTGSEREVELEGEAYFEVTKNQKMPFHVKTRNQEVDVLGTHFVIMAYSDEPVIKTTLLEGSVRINSENTGTLLSPGDQALVGKTIIVDKHANLEEAIAWKNNVFEFNSADIKTIMRAIGRWYDVDIKYEGNFNNQKLTAIVSRESNASELLQILSTSGFHFKIDGKSITVMP
jgi:transmembrane sensor